MQVGSREFSVISHSYNATCYMVSSGDDKNMSYCTCSYGTSHITRVNIFSWISEVFKLILGRIIFAAC